MLTRIEIDGFKTFRDFALDVPPFLAVVGPNAAGKSNLLEALDLLRNLAESDVGPAFSRARGTPREQFHRRPDGSPGDRITLAVEVLLSPAAADQWGVEVLVNHSRLRYEVTIVFRDDGGAPGLYVDREAVLPIEADTDDWPKRNQVSSGFAQNYLRYARSSPLLETVDIDGRPTFVVTQEGRGGLRRPAGSAKATVLSSMADASAGLLFALRAELRSWRGLRPDPTQLMRPDPPGAPDVLAADGGNLASALRRIERETGSQDGTRGAVADISADLARLVPGVTDVAVEQDSVTRELNVLLTVRGEAPVRSRLASEGTLRILLLLAALYDPDNRGLLCVEEPENGVHPENLRSLVILLTELVTDPAEQETGPLTQLLVTSHSPVLVGALRPRELVFLDVVDRIHHGTVERISRVRPMSEAAPAAVAAEIGAAVTRAEVDRYLDVASVER